jgi:hypothetical protein
MQASASKTHMLRDGRTKGKFLQDYEIYIFHSLNNKDVNFNDSMAQVATHSLPVRLAPKAEYPYRRKKT